MLGEIPGILVLTIMIPTIPERRKAFRVLQHEVQRQINYCHDIHPTLGEVEIIFDASRKFTQGGVSIGKKRGNLVKRAQGKYVCFLDDDDGVSPDYVETLLRLCNEDADVCTFRNISKFDAYWAVFDLALGNPNEQSRSNDMVLRKPWHTCPIRREFAQAVEFPDTSYGEDWEWFEKVLLFCKTEAKTKAVIHEYHHSIKTSEADKIVDSMKKPKRCVVSFADTPFYLEKMERLKASITTPGVDFVGFTDVAQIGCEPHSVIPYKFKPYAIKKAIEMGYESILWCDSPIVQVKDLSPVFEHIEKHGFVFFDNVGHSLGMWTNDKALNHFGMTREQAMNVQMIMACCMGFSGFEKNQKGRDLMPVWLWDYIDFANELYPGSWDNHRHDQTVMSFLIHKYGLEILNGQQTFFMYESHRFAVPINEETICLISK